MVIKSVKFLAALSFFSSCFNYAMDRQQLSGDGNLALLGIMLQHYWPQYIHSDVHKGQFWISKPFPHEPYHLHRLGVPCQGHSEDTLYPIVALDTIKMNRYVQAAQAVNDFKGQAYFLRSARFLEAYLDATCAVSEHKAKRLDALEAVLHLAGKIGQSKDIQVNVDEISGRALSLLLQKVKEGDFEAGCIFSRVVKSGSVKITKEFMCALVQTKNIKCIDILADNHDAVERVFGKEFFSVLFNPQDVLDLEAESKSNKVAALMLSHIYYYMGVIAVGEQKIELLKKSLEHVCSVGKQSKMYGARVGSLHMLLSAEYACKSLPKESKKHLNLAVVSGYPAARKLYAKSIIEDVKSCPADVQGAISLYEEDARKGDMDLARRLVIWYSDDRMSSRCSLSQIEKSKRCVEFADLYCAKNPEDKEISYLWALALWDLLSAGALQGVEQKIYDLLNFSLPGIQDFEGKGACVLAMVCLRQGNYKEAVKNFSSVSENNLIARVFVGFAMMVAAEHGLHDFDMFIHIQMIEQALADCLRLSPFVIESYDFRPMVDYFKQKAEHKDVQSMAILARLLMLHKDGLYGLSHSEIKGKYLLPAAKQGNSVALLCLASLENIQDIRGITRSLHYVKDVIKGQNLPDYVLVEAVVMALKIISYGKVSSEMMESIQQIFQVFSENINHIQAQQILYVFKYIKNMGADIDKLSHLKVLGIWDELKKRAEGGNDFLAAYLGLFLAKGFLAGEICYEFCAGHIFNLFDLAGKKGDAYVSHEQVGNFYLECYKKICYIYPFVQLKKLIDRVVLYNKDIQGPDAEIVLKLKALREYPLTLTAFREEVYVQLKTLLVAQQASINRLGLTKLLQSMDEKISFFGQELLFYRSGIQCLLDEKFPNAVECFSLAGEINKWVEGYVVASMIYFYWMHNKKDAVRSVIKAIDFFIAKEMSIDKQILDYITDLGLSLDGDADSSSNVLASLLREKLKFLGKPIF